MKGTKLWQSPGSPIIQGRSRRQPSFLLMWLPAWVAAALGVIAITLSIFAGNGPSYFFWGFAVLGALAGSFLGVIVSRAMGWRFQWLWGLVLGLAGAGVAVVSTQYVMSVVMSTVGVIA